MIQRSFCFTILVMVLVALASAAYAYPTHPNEVPEASVCILAPMGIAAVVAAERRRRKMANIRRGVGALYFIVKRSVDVVLASAILLASSPLVMIMAVLVRLDSPGPVFFKRRVVGKNGRSFDMYKFRSMVDGAEEILARDKELKKQYYIKCKLETDPRVTRLGKFLRVTSLDELPQLINVLLGNMTFVGPRPIAADETYIYGPRVERFKTVTPGITGMWQTCGRSETSYEKRVEMDMCYIDNRSILLDLWIIVYTLPAVMLKRGAC